MTDDVDSDPTTAADPDPTTTDGKPPADADGDGEAEGPGARRRRRRRQRPELPPAERWLRLALITVGAALVASLLSLWGARDHDDPAASAERTAEVGTGVVVTELTARDDGQTLLAEVTTRFADPAYDTTVTDDDSAAPALTATGDDPSDFDPDAQTAPGPWPVELTPELVGWSTGGIEELIDALELPDDTDGEPATATLTVAEVQALPEIPAPLALAVHPEWGWAGGEDVAVTVTLADGYLATLVAVVPASADGVSTSIRTETTYDGLGTDVTIDLPADDG